MALGILGGCVFFGGNDTIREAHISLKNGGGPMASFMEAEAHLGAAVRNLEEAERLTDPADKDVTYKSAFDHPFDAARHSALVHLHRGYTRRSGIGRDLPWPYDDNFKAMSTTLYIQYAYDGNYPRDTRLTRSEDEDWYNKVSRFINDLRERVREREQDP